MVGASTGEREDGPPGNTRAYDARTGAKLWEFVSVPRPGDAWAHHSFPAEFDQKQIVKLKGTVVQFEWVNPHAMIHL